MRMFHEMWLVSVTFGMTWEYDISYHICQSHSLWRWLMSVTFELWHPCMYHSLLLFVWQECLLCSNFSSGHFHHSLQTLPVWSCQFTLHRKLNTHIDTSSDKCMPFWHVHLTNCFKDKGFPWPKTLHFIRDAIRNSTEHEYILPIMLFSVQVPLIIHIRLWPTHLYGSLLWGTSFGWEANGIWGHQ